MSQQRTFGDLAWDGKKKVTRREQSLAEMNDVIPWRELVRLVAPHYPKSKTGRPAMPIEIMLRIYFAQQWFNLSDPAAEAALLRQRVDPALRRGRSVGRRDSG